MNSFGNQVRGIILMNCAEEILLKRLLEDRADSGRVDDTPEIFSKRLREFHESVEEIEECLAGILEEFSWTEVCDNAFEQFF